MFVCELLRAYSVLTVNDDILASNVPCVNVHTLYVSTVRSGHVCNNDGTQLSEQLFNRVTNVGSQVQSPRDRKDQMLGNQCHKQSRILEVVTLVILENND